MEVEGDELPILDGSGAIYYEIFKNLKSRREKPVTFKNRLMFKNQKSMIFYIPSDNLKIYGLFPYGFRIFHASYQEGLEKRVVEAKTFGWRIKSFPEIKEIKRTKNFTYLPPLRKNEFASHKILDFLGDLALSSIYLLGKFFIFSSSHRANHLFVKKIVKNRGEWI